MKQIVKNYVFNTTAKTLVLGDYTANGLVAERIQLIVDVSINTILYNFADASVSGIGVVAETITFTTLPAGVNNSDKIQVIYQNQTGDPTYDTQSITDGSDVNAGSINDAANTTATTGTMSGKLRGILSILSNVWSSANGWLTVSLGTLIAGEDLTNNRLNTIILSNPYNINTATTTVVKSGSGRIIAITCNTPVAAATAQLYNNTAAGGTKIGLITVPATAANPFTLEINGGAFTTGLTVVTTGTADWTFWVA